MPFISLSCLFSLVRTSSIMLSSWINVVTVGTIILFLVLKGKLSIFHHWICYLWVCYMWAVLCWVTLLCTQSVEYFNHEKIFYFIKCSFCTYRDDHMIFIFLSMNVVCHTDWFVCVESMVYNLFNVLNSVCYYSG